jgi:AhpD family alkylhydroperoxidase
MHADWNDLIDGLRGSLRELRGGAPEVMKAFSAVAQAASKASALDTKTKELIALAVSVAIRCDDCIAFHAKAAVEQGAAREEVIEAVGMAIYMERACRNVCKPCHRGVRPAQVPQHGRGRRLSPSVIRPCRRSRRRSSR